MLVQTQAVVTQATVNNAAALAVAIAAQVIGNSIGDRLHGENVTREAINQVVASEIENKFFPQGVQYAR